jgi:hypothetical protein
MRSTVDHRRGLPRAARLRHGRSVRAPGRRLRRRPDGQWTVTGSCRDPAYQSPEAVTYYDQTQNMARQPPPEPTSSDWCSYLLYDPVQGITQFTFPHDTLADRHRPPVTYDAAGTYAALLATAARQHRHLGELPLPLLGHLPVRSGRCGRRRRHPFGRGRSDGVFGVRSARPNRTSRAPTTAPSAACAATRSPPSRAAAASAGAGARRARCSRTSPAPS